jgi:predicted metal-dependent HD superfamily phosphohydrolase
VRQITGRRLRRRWLVFLARCAPGKEGEAPFRRLGVLYSHPDRHYHNWRHILDCLRAFGPERSRCHDPLAVEMAIWFHDAVYDPRRHDNEYESARLARRSGRALGLSEAFLGEVEKLILQTDHSRGPVLPSSKAAADDAGLLRDIDLAVLGARRRRYAGYEAAIRREYAYLSEGEYRAGRVRFIEGLLARPFLYETQRFRRRCERRARRNLRSALLQLGRIQGAPGGPAPGRRPGG